MKGLDPLKLHVGQIKLPTEPHQISVEIRGDHTQITCAEESAKPERSETCGNGHKQDRHFQKQAVGFRMREFVERDRWTGHISLPNGSKSLSSSVKLQPSRLSSRRANQRLLPSKPSAERKLASRVS